MRVAMFMPSLGPRALGWNVHLDFADAVRHLGHDFELLTTAAPGSRPAATGGAPEDRPVATILDVPGGWRRLAIPARPLLRTRQLLPAAGALAAHLADQGEDIDLLHLEVAYPHGAAAALAVATSGWDGLVAVTPMGEDVLVVRNRSYGLRRYPVPAALVRWTLRRASGLRCISPMFAEHIGALAPRNRRRVIPLNISRAAAAMAQRSAAERARFRQTTRAEIDRRYGTAGRPLVLSFGRLHPFKGVDVLIEAATRIGDATVLVIGPSLTVRPFGDMATDLGARVERAGVAEKVRIAGAIPPTDALGVLAAADVVVVPSPLESLNKVCMEAAAVGTPFVVTETTGVSAWVPDEGVGIVVPPSNPTALAWAIDEVLEGHFVADPAATAAFASRFAPHRIATQVMDFYQEIAAAV